MSVIRTARAVGIVAGRLVDADDRAVLAQLVVWALGFLCVAMILAVSLGVAVRVFALTAG